MGFVVRCLLCLIVTVSGWKVIQALSEEEAMKAIENFSSDCEPKPTEEDLRNIVRSVKDAPKSTKCLRLCLINKMNLFENCKMDGDNLFNLMEIMFDDKEVEIHEIANICNSKVTCTDECEAAHDYAMCMLDEIKTRGWPMDDFTF